MKESGHSTVEAKGMLRKVEVNLSAVVDFGPGVTRYGSFPYALAVILKRYNVSFVEYRAAHGQWNPVWSDGVALSAWPSGEWVAAAPASSSLRELWPELIADISSIVGGAMGAGFGRTQPFVVAYSNELAQQFPHTAATAEAVPKLKELLWAAMDDVAAEQLDHRALHRAPWYGLALQFGIAPDGGYSLRADVHWLDMSASPTLWKDETSGLQIQRSAWSAGGGVISVATTMHNPHPTELAVYCVEALPAQASLLPATLQWVAEGEASLLRPPAPSSTDGSSRAWAFNVTLPPRSTHTLRFQAQVHLQGTHAVPPDASRGLLLSGLVATTAMGRFFAPAALLATPIPDLSMPYTVCTLVSTLLAFVLGSLINLLVKVLKGKPITPAVAATAATPATDTVVPHPALASPPPVLSSQTGLS